MKNFYTLKNDFHNTEARILIEGLSHIHNEVEITPSKSQARRISKKLCGNSDCTCGGYLGQRGTQIQESGKRLIINPNKIWGNK